MRRLSLKAFLANFGGRERSHRKITFQSLGGRGEGEYSKKVGSTSNKLRIRGEPKYAHIKSREARNTLLKIFNAGPFFWERSVLRSHSQKFLVLFCSFLFFRHATSGKARTKRLSTKQKHFFCFVLHYRTIERPTKHLRGFWGLKHCTRNNNTYT